MEIEKYLQKKKRGLIKIIIWLCLYLGATIWLFTIDYKIGLAVTFIVLAVSNGIDMELDDLKK